MSVRFSLLLAAMTLPAAADHLAWTGPEGEVLLRAIVPDQGLRGLVRKEGTGDGIALPDHAPAIRWAGLLPPEFGGKPRPLLAHRSFEGTTVGIEEWSDPVATNPASPGPWPPGICLAGGLRWQAFGREERVKVNQGFVATAGNAPAGVVSEGRGRLPAKTWSGEVSLHLSFRGSGRWQLAAEFEEPGKDPLPLAELNAKTESRESTVKLDRLPADKPFRLTLLAPQGGGSLHLDECRFGSAAIPAGIARWDWSADLARWPSHAGTWQEISVAYPRDLIGLPEVANEWRTKLRLTAVEGDPAMILPGEAPKLAGRLRALSLLEPAWRPDAVQLDIEPYLLPGYLQQSAHWNRRWLETLQAAKAGANGLPVEVVLPWWALQHPAFNEVLDKLAGVASGVVVMNYRTDLLAALQTGAAWLEWGARHRLPVALAVELGPLPATSVQRFEPSPRGTLWLADAGPAGTLAVWFERELEQVPSGRLLAATGPLQTRSAAATTFHGRPEEARAMIRALGSLPSSNTKSPRPVFVHEPPAGFTPSAAGD